MRKSINKPEKPENGLFSVKKILIISIVFFIIAGMMGVMASNNQVKNVKIILPSGYEMNVVTTKNVVSEILKENEIETYDDETITPDLNSELTDNNTITISTEEKAETKTAESYISEDDILASYTSIVEKIVTVEEEIPFETITKDVSNDSENTQERVTQEGENGIKEVTYKIQYQNGEEISKEVVSENVTKEPVDKIVEVRTKVVTSRYGTRATSGNVAEYQAYAYTKCMEKGWSESDFDCLVSLWNKESGWNIYAYNASSGALGIPQACPGSKMAANGSDYLTNYKTQINWGINYIYSRYGNPTNAWARSCSTNSY